jgi:hypothetical protein
MSRNKRLQSTVIDTAKDRIPGLTSIDPKLDLGNGLSLSAYQAQTDKTAASLNAYNLKISEADDAQNIFEAEETTLNDLNTRLLAAVGASYGKDSDEYALAGGTKTSDRKKPAKKAATSK